MIAQNQLMVVAVTVGMTLGSFSPTQPAIALQLEAITTIPPDSTPLGWKQEGRAGASEGTDYEFAIGPNGVQADNTGQIYSDWEWEASHSHAYR